MSTLIETIAVLVLLGILAAVAVPRYMDITEEARVKVASGQIGQVKGRLTAAMSRYMVENSGAQPVDGAALITYANAASANTCPASATTDGDFTFKCEMGTGREVIITVNEVQGKALSTVATGNYRY